MTETVVTTFLRHRGRVLLVRSDERWDALSTTPRGDESPATAAWRRVHERLGVETTTVREGGVLAVEGRRLHPFLLDVDAWPGPDRGAFPAPTDRDDGDRDDDGDREWEWVHPPAILRRETVPGLWRAYERVAPTLRTVVADDEHGSTWLSVRALEALRDRAGLLAARDPGDADWAELTDLGERLRTARPGMAVVENRVNRAMATADDRTAAAVETAAVERIERAIDADDEAADAAADLVEGERVLTLSRSGTVLRALRTGDPERVFVAESRPDREGVAVAEAVARAGERVTLHTDAAMGTVLADHADIVLVGADAVHPDGSVVNKTGTRTLAAAAAHEGVPVYVVAASEKVATGPVRTEAGPGATLYDGEAAVEVHAPVFDTTPPDLVAAVVTERGRRSTADVDDLADELRSLAAWPERAADRDG